MKNLLIFITGLFVGFAAFYFLANSSVVDVVSSSETSSDYAPALVQTPIEEPVEAVVEESAAPKPLEKGMTLFPEPSDKVTKGHYEIFDVLESGCALAYKQEHVTGDTYMTLASCMVVLFLPEEGKYYYDNQIIIASTNKPIHHVGIYKYKSRYDGDKTVPVLSLN